MGTVQEIERAIISLNREQLSELYEWLDEYDDSPMADARESAENDNARLAWLRQAVNEGFAASESGEYVEFKSEQQMRDHLHRRALEVLAEEQGRD